MRGQLLFLLFAAWAFRHAGAESALKALGHIPKDQLPRLAKIEGRDGTPEPERWYILVYDPAAENGVHEFVVADGQVVASRSISQFADTLTAADLFPAGAVQTDSTQAGKLASDYAAANGATSKAINYELKKTGTNAVPDWKVSCVNDTGAPIGEVTVAAAGNPMVISHEGFVLTPEDAASPATPKPEAPARKTPKFDVYAKPVVAPGEVPPNGTGELLDGRAHRHRTPPKKQTIGDTFKNVGRTLHNFFPF